MQTDLLHSGTIGRNSLSFRIAAIFVTAIVVVAVSVAIFEIDRERNRFNEETLRIELHRVSTAAETYRAEIGDLRSDLRILSEVPPIAGIIRATDDPLGIDRMEGTGMVFWKTRLEEIFRAFIASHEHYRQIRLIGVADDGRELIRVEKVPNAKKIDPLANDIMGIRTVRGDGLQRKAGRDYFREGLKLKPGQIHLTDITLNREHGQIEEPRWPALRGIVPIYDKRKGRMFGMIVINIDVQAAFNQIKKNASVASQVFVLSEKGDFLVHPDPSKEFAFEFGPPFRWKDMFPDAELGSHRHSEMAEFGDPHTHSYADSDDIIAHSRILYDPEDRSRFVDIVFRQRNTSLLASFEQSTFWVLLACLAAAIAASALVVAYLRHELRPLNQLTDAARNIRFGEMHSQLPKTTIEELHPLATAMAELQQEMEIKNQSPVMIHSVDAEGRLIFVNHYWLESLGFQRHEVMGHPLSDFQTAASKLRDAADFARFLEQGSTRNLSLEFVTKGGDIRRHLLSAQAIRDAEGNFVRSIAVMIDITEKLEVEAALRRTEEMFERAFQSAGIGAALVTLDGGIHKMNRKLAEILDRDFDDLGSQSILDLVVPEDLPLMRSAIERLESENDELDPFEVYFLRRDGTTVPTMTSFGVVHDPDGSHAYLICQVSDLTNLKQAEAQFRQAQKMEVIGNLTGGIAHDFNNILGIVLGNLQLLQRRLTGGNPVLKLAEDAIDATKRGAELTRQLLAFSRRQVLEPKVVELNEMIGRMERMLRRTLTENIVIEIEPSPVPRKVKVDPAQLESAILNLSINARDAMSKGGKLTIGIGLQHLGLLDTYIINDIQPGDYAVVTVTDSGHGMPANLQDKIFEPFFTTKAVGRGSGLGLSMVYGFVKQSGGTIHVYSEEGVGTRFSIYLPVYTGDEIDGGTEAASLDRPHGSGTILLVEDESALRRVAAQQLEELGYKVIAAEDGASALETLRFHADIDLLLSDMIMPGGYNGHQLADEIRETRPDISVVITSGYPRDGFDTGRRYRFLQKPFTQESLARTVRAALDEDGKSEGESGRATS
jgi:PAS domain S-box-containing protein